MAKKTANRPTIDAVKTTVRFPAALMKELREAVPRRGQSAFVAEAVEEKLRRIKLLEALDSAFGAWKAKDHPEMGSPAEIRRWVRRLRRQGRGTGWAD